WASSPSRPAPTSSGTLPRSGRETSPPLTSTSGATIARASRSTFERLAIALAKPARIVSQRKGDTPPRSGPAPADTIGEARSPADVSSSWPTSPGLQIGNARRRAVEAPGENLRQRSPRASPIDSRLRPGARFDSYDRAG